MGGRQILLAARSLARAPRYTLAVVVTFALVIEASTLFFAVVDAVVLRPLPYPEPEELVFVGQERDEGPPGVTSAYALLRLAEGTEAVEGVAAFSTYVITLTGAGDPIRLNLAYTSASYFDVVGVPPAVGRGFLDAEAGPGAPSVVVISDRLWRDRFGADPALVGRTVRLDEWPYEVVGIMPPGFRAPDELFRDRVAATDVWMPSPRDPLADGPGYQTVRGVARLAPGASLERLEAEADLVAAGLRAEHPENFSGRAFAVRELKEAVVGETGLRILVLLGLAVALVVLVGCANVANLAVTRSLAREGSRAVRVALGAGRGHLAVEVGAEVLVLALLGGLAGLGLAVAGLHVFLGNAPPLPLLDRVGISGTVAATTFAITVVAAFLGALAPSWEVSSRAPAVALPRGGSASAHRWTGAQHAFAGFQVAAAVALLASSLFVHGSLRSLLAVDRGFDERGVRVAQIDLPAQRYDDPASRVRFTREAVAALEGRAGIETVAFVTSAPQIGINNFGTRVVVEGQEDQDPDARPVAFFRAITPGYLRAMGVDLVRGRSLDERDVADGSPLGALVNREFARRHLAGEDPLGQSLNVFGDGGIRIVGVVEDVRYGGFDQQPVPELYLPFDGRFNTVFLVAKAGGDAATVTTALREAIHRLDPSIPMNGIQSMEALVSRSVEVERFLRLLVSALAALALVLSVVGTYAVLAETVARRTRELAIRVALGGTRSALLGSVLARGFAVIVGGVGFGLLGAYWAGRGLEGVLFGVSARDPLVFLASSGLMVLVGLPACWLPARRATRADPLEALRAE